MTLTYGRKIYINTKQIYNMYLPIYIVMLNTCESNNILISKFIN